MTSKHFKFLTQPIATRFIYTFQEHSWSMLSSLILIALLLQSSLSLSSNKQVVFIKSILSVLCPACLIDGPSCIHRHCRHMHQVVLIFTQDSYLEPCSYLCEGYGLMCEMGLVTWLQSLLAMVFFGVKNWIDHMWALRWKSKEGCQKAGFFFRENK